ncbi:HRDC domain-containing protein [Epilithonimonas xixisoli]|uniref:HRDC domain-containing protein n=1 Tax=Epilithonimonas xixisoli TaxID=1476462 RepID=A0A4V3H2X7_9FLAO|nr:HRDC domain-containing protein [Epilithonimonas xixisoli]TDX86811.1 HRDC domain-containing protein [Epilithonimonas xixisoli]
MKVKIFKIRVSEEFLESDQELINNFLAQSEVLHTNSKLIEEEINYWSVLISYEEKKLKNISSKAIPISEDELSEEETIIYNKLKDWRSEKAKETQLPAYIIFHNAHLVSIARYKPNNLEDLEQINGLGKSKTEKYGAEIIEVLENA